MGDRLYAENINYWKTGKSQPETWLDRAEAELKKVPGSRVVGRAFGGLAGSESYMFAFAVDGDKFKIVWPVLQSKTNDVKAARVQAATMLFYDVKHRCVVAKVFGARIAFFSNLLLPDGRTVAELETPEIAAGFTGLLGSGR